MPETMRSVNEIWSDLKASRKRVQLRGVDYWLVEGDLALDVDQLLAYAFELQARQHPSASGETREPLVARTADDGRPLRWRPGRVLSYAIRKATFDLGDRYPRVQAALLQATADWAAICQVIFQYREDLDAVGVSDAGEPLFWVECVDTGGRFLALAFFPDTDPARRILYVDPAYFSPDHGFDPAGILRHEIGHILGFRHEHIRSEAPALCPDEPLGNTLNLTDYDPTSVMHYFCGAVGTRDLKITAVDREAAQRLYSSPASAVYDCD